MQGRVEAAENRVSVLESEVKVKDVELNGALRCRETVEAEKVHICPPFKS